MLDLILGAGVVVKAVLALLLVLSVASWAIIWFKARELGVAERATHGFLDAYLVGSLASAREAARDFPQSPLCVVFECGHEDLRRLREREGTRVEPEALEGVVQRLGWVQTRVPEQTERALVKLVPRRYWPILNEVFVAHGKAICRPIGPRCGECSVSRGCPTAAGRGASAPRAPSRPRARSRGSGARGAGRPRRSSRSR